MNFFKSEGTLQTCIAKISPSNELHLEPSRIPLNHSKVYLQKESDNEMSQTLKFKFLLAG